MGVQGLWTLLSPAGRRVPAEILAGKVVAVDASIWIVEFLHGLKTAEGAPMPGAVLVGFFNRLCRLLYFRVRPVIVFDGPPPALKNRTLAERRRQRTATERSLRSVALRLLVNRLQQSTLKTNSRALPQQPSEEALASQQPLTVADNSSVEVVSRASVSRCSEARSSVVLSKEKQSTPPPEAASHASSEVRLFNSSEDAESVANSDGGSDCSQGAGGLDSLDLLWVAGLAHSHSVCTPEENICLKGVRSRESVFTLPQSSRKGKANPQDTTRKMVVQLKREHRVFRSPQEFKGYMTEDGGRIELPLDSSIDPEVFEKLPPTLQYQTLIQIRDAWAEASRFRALQAKKTPALFSNVQLEGYIRAIRTNKEIEAVKTKMAELQQRQEREVQELLVKEQPESYSEVKDLPQTAQDAAPQSAAVQTLPVVKPESPVGAAASLSRSLPSIYTCGAPRRKKKFVNDLHDLQRLHEERPERNPSSLHLSHLKPEELFDGGAAQTLVDAAKRKEQALLRRVAPCSADDQGASVFTDVDGSRVDEFVVKEEIETREETPLCCSCRRRSTQSLSAVRELVTMDDDEIFGRELLQPEFRQASEKPSETAEEREEVSGVSGFGTGVGCFQAEAAFSELQVSDSETSSQGSDFEECELDAPTLPLASTFKNIVSKPIATLDSHVEEECNSLNAEQHPPSASFEAPFLSAKTARRILPLEKLFEAEPRQASCRSPKKSASSFQLMSKSANSDNTSAVNPRSISSPSVRCNVETIGAAEKSVPEASASLLAITDCAETEDIVEVVPPSKAWTTLIRKSAGDSLTTSPAAVSVHRDSDADGVSPAKNVPSDAALSGEAGEDGSDFMQLWLNVFPHLRRHVQGEEAIRSRSHSKEEESDLLVATASVPGESFGKTAVVSEDAELEALIDDHQKLQAEAHEEGVAVLDEVAPPPLPLAIEDLTPSSINEETSEGSAELAPRLASAPSSDHPPSVPSSSDAGPSPRSDAHSTMPQVIPLSTESPSRNTLVALARADQEEFRFREMLEEQQQMLMRQLGSFKARGEIADEETKTQIVHLLEAFGVPFVFAPAEAEATAAALSSRGLVDAVMSDDSDALVFGASEVYRNFFSSRKTVEVYAQRRVKQLLDFDREKLICLAMLLGCDYTGGVKGVGPVNAVEVVKAFPTFASLRHFRDWCLSPFGGDATPEDNAAVARFKRSHCKYRLHWHLPLDFPSPEVYQAFSAPTVAECNSRFSFGLPNVEAILSLLTKVTRIPREEAEATLSAAVKRYTAPGSFLRQPEISDFFPTPQAPHTSELQQQQLQQQQGHLQGREEECPSATARTTALETSSSALSAPLGKVKEEFSLDTRKETCVSPQESSCLDFGAAGQFKSKRILRALGWGVEHRKCVAGVDASVSLISETTSEAKKASRASTEPHRAGRKSKRLRVEPRSEARGAEAFSSSSSPCSTRQVVGAETEEDASEAARDAAALVQELHFTSLDLAAEEAANAL